MLPIGLDGIEVRGRGRQRQEAGAGGFDGFPASRDFGGGQMVQDGYVCGEVRLVPTEVGPEFQRAPLPKLLADQARDRVELVRPRR